MTWDLVIRSFAVLGKDRKLILFPLLSGILGLALAVLCFYSPLTGALRRGSPVTEYAVLFLCYCAFQTGMIFCNCALAACAQVRFAGGSPSLADGWRRAAGRIGPIVWWALLSATVGLVLRAVLARVGFLGRIASRLLGFAWELATFLVVPVLVIEDLDVRASIRRSAGLLRATWGEQLTVNLSLGWIFLLFAIPGIVLGVLGRTASLGPAPAVLYFLLLIAAITAVGGIFEVALYRYAVSGQPPDGYSAAMLRGAVKPRR